MKNETKKPILDGFFSQHESVRQGQMFGYPAYYVGRTMFACLYEGKLGLKVPEEIANMARERKEIGDFQPHGKPKMREWIAFEFYSEKELNQNEKLILGAVQYAKLRAANSQRK